MHDFGLLQAYNATKDTIMQKIHSLDSEFDLGKYCRRRF